MAVDFAVVGAGLAGLRTALRTGGCYAAHFPVRVWTTCGSAFREPCRRIHWAGTETSREWHGYMEGALHSGDRAAADMLRADS
jgi:monoamine oxidase